jgi:endonuclease III
LDTNKNRNHALTKILLARHGRTFSDELDIEIHANTPSALFRLLVAAMLFSSRINARLAMQAARALTDQGWVTPEKMVAASWEERTRTLNRSGYARYDERTSRMLEDTARSVLDRYQGDLRNLREASGRDMDRERQRLKEFKGIGNVGVDIFLREAQVAWGELFPFVDERSRQNAKELGLPTDAQSLLELVGKDDFPRLVSALIRVGLAGDHEEMLKEVHRTEKIL